MTTQSDNGRVCFRLFRPGAQQVRLAGDFNGWSTAATPMHPEPDGHWVCELELAPGSYQFRYFADDTWLLDCAAFGLQLGPFGWNSVVYVRPTLAA